MDKIKILQFPIANSNGGITHYALNNWKWMDKNIFQCDFATMSKKLDFADEIVATGSEIYYISCYAEENTEQFKKDVRKILENRYDIVHLHTKQWKSFIMEELCIECGVPKIIVHSHSTGIDTLDPEKRRFETKLHEEIKKKFNVSLATDFWACSQLAADFLFGEQIPKDRIKIMNNAIDVARFSYNREIRKRYREQYHLEDSFVIGNVARFDYQKNHEFLIDVFAEVAKKVPESKLALIGDGELRKDIENKVKETGMDKKVLFLGKRDDVNNWYQAMDMFCLPSRFEGLPISVIEAQAAGLPCVVSDTVTEEVKVEQNVSMVSNNDKSGWIKTIIIQAAEGAKRYTADHIKNLYSISENIARIEREYKGWPEEIAGTI